MQIVPNDICLYNVTKLTSSQPGYLLATQQYALSKHGNSGHTYFVFTTLQHNQKFSEDKLDIRQAQMPAHFKKLLKTFYLRSFYDRHQTL